jgi:hypothetical protein
VLGSISNLGGQYVIGLNTVGCSSGDTLATEPEQAATKQDVLKALGTAASALRGKLGESLAPSRSSMFQWKQPLLLWRR